MRITTIKDVDSTKQCARVISGVFRGASVRCPPLWPDHENFLQATLYEKVRFCHFSARIAKFNNVWWSFAFPNFRKMGKFAVSIEHSDTKSVSTSGGLRPSDSPTRGSAPRPRWGLCPQTPVIGSRSARSPWPPFPNPKYATAGDRLHVYMLMGRSPNRVWFYKVFAAVGWVI